MTPHPAPLTAPNAIDLAIKSDEIPQAFRKLSPAVPPIDQWWQQRSQSLNATAYDWLPVCGNRTALMMLVRRAKQEAVAMCWMVVYTHFNPNRIRGYRVLTFPTKKARKSFLNLWLKREIRITRPALFYLSEVD